MDELSRLLTSSARRPRQELDVVALEHRVRTLRRNRTLLLATAAACAIGVAVGVPTAAGLVRAHRPATLTPVAPAPSATSLVSPRPGLAHSLAPPVHHSRAMGSGPAPEPLPTGVPAPFPRRSNHPTEAPPSDTGYPAQASCEVTTEGLAPGGSRTCRFRATAAGGWRYRVQGGLGTRAGTRYMVLVTRDGVTQQNPGDTGADCANDVILPGDLVEVVVYQESQGYIVRRVGAGSGMRCGA